MTLNFNHVHLCQFLHVLSVYQDDSENEAMDVENKLLVCFHSLKENRSIRQESFVSYSDNRGNI